MKCTNNEIYIVLISLHIVMHRISSWTQQQHWNYRQTASQGCSTSCLCWFCDSFKEEYCKLPCRQFTLAQNTESAKQAVLLLHQLISFCWRRSIFTVEAQDALYSHCSCALWGNPYVVSCGCCWTYPTLLIGIVGLLRTAATLFQIYCIVLYCMSCPCYLTEAITCIKWWGTEEQRGPLLWADITLFTDWLQLTVVHQQL